MKRMVLLLAVFSTGVFAAKAPPMSKSEVMCREQSILITQTYDMFRRGYSQEAALQAQTSATTSPMSRAWIRNMISKIFTDPRSMYVDANATGMAHERECNGNPPAYAMDPKDLQ